MNVITYCQVGGRGGRGRGGGSQPLSLNRMKIWFFFSKQRCRVTRSKPSNAKQWSYRGGRKKKNSALPFMFQHQVGFYWGHKHANTHTHTADNICALLAYCSVLTTRLTGFLFIVKNEFPDGWCCLTLEVKVDKGGKSSSWNAPKICLFVMTTCQMFRLPGNQT